MTFKSTPQAAQELGIPVSTLAKAVWSNRVERPAMGPGNSFLWGEMDIERARKVFKRSR